MSGGSGFVADVDGLLRTVQQMTRCAGELRDLLDEVDRSVGDLHVTWSGEAAGAHHEAHRVWAAGFREMQDGLDTMRRIADAARDNYESAATTNARMWEQVR